MYCEEHHWVYCKEDDVEVCDECGALREDCEELDNIAFNAILSELIYAGVTGRVIA